MKMYRLIYLMIFISILSVLLGILDLTIGFNFSSKIQLMSTTLLVSLVASMQILTNLLLLVLNKDKLRKLKLTI